MDDQYFMKKINDTLYIQFFINQYIVKFIIICIQSNYLRPSKSI